MSTSHHRMSTTAPEHALPSLQHTRFLGRPPQRIRYDHAPQQSDLRTAPGSRITLARLRGLAARPPESGASASSRHRTTGLSPIDVRTPASSIGTPVQISSLARALQPQVRYEIRASTVKTTAPGEPVRHWIHGLHRAPYASFLRLPTTASRSFPPVPSLRTPWTIFFAADD